MKNFFACVILGYANASSLGDTMRQLANSVKSVVPMADNSLAIDAMTSDGILEASDQVDSTTGHTLLERIVQTLVDSRLDTLFYTGGCHRNYTAGCPMGWTETAGICSPEDSSGPCSSFDLSKIETAPEFAIKCKAQWPCASCVRDFSGCPLHWEKNENLCVPTQHYIGPCTDAVDFSHMKNKPQWAAICYAEWPCLKD